MLFLLCIVAGIIQVNGQTNSEIEKAAKACKPVFLVACNVGGADTVKAMAMANEARKSYKGSSVVIKMNTSDATNSALVTKYRLAGAPMPLILVLDKNSTVTGGLPFKDASAAKLVEMIPSAKTSEVLKAISEGKSVYMVAYRESMGNQKNIMDNCAMACSKMDNKSITVKVDMNDKKEATLLQSLKCDMNAKEPVTYVINKSGQVIGTHNGITDVNTLVSTAKKAPASGCCPTGAPAGGCK